ncbi:MAG: hypothetical protein ABI759_27920 [Candidatus Solibacter sp.]
MFPFHLDVALNLVWLAISFAALLWFARREWKSGRRAISHGRLQRLFAICLMAVALFPCISDSDDLFHFSLLQVPTSQTGGVGTEPHEERQEPSNLQLQRLLETLEHFQVSAFYLFLFTLCCLALALFLRVSSYSRATRCYAGRAPPLT